MDLANLLINVRDQQAEQKLTQLGGKLDSLASKAEGVGKAFLAGWSFTKIIQGMKQVGDAFTREIRLNNLFFQNFSRNNNLAVQSLNNLKKELSITNLQAKELMSNFASRLRFFEFDQSSLTNMSYALSKIASDVASAYGESIDTITESLFRAMMGQTRGLNRFGFKLDTSSEVFQERVQTFKVEGYTEAQAQVKAIFEEIIKQSSQFEGATKKNMSSIGKQLENLANTFKDEILTKLGNFFSVIFNPIIKLIDSILSSKIGQITLLSGVFIALFPLVSKLTAGCLKLFSALKLFYTTKIISFLITSWELMFLSFSNLKNLKKLIPDFDDQMLKRISGSMSSKNVNLFKLINDGFTNFFLKKGGVNQLIENISYGFRKLNVLLNQDFFFKDIEINFSKFISSMSNLVSNVLKLSWSLLANLTTVALPVGEIVAGVVILYQQVKDIANFIKDFDSSGLPGIEGQAARMRVESAQRTPWYRMFDWGDWGTSLGKKFSNWWYGEGAGTTEEDAIETSIQYLKKAEEERKKTEAALAQLRGKNFLSIFQDINVKIFDDQYQLTEKLYSTIEAQKTSLELKIKEYKNLADKTQHMSRQDFNKELNEYLRFEAKYIQDEFGYISDRIHDPEVKERLKDIVQDFRELFLKADTPGEGQKLIDNYLKDLQYNAKGTDYEALINKFVKGIKNRFIDLADSPDKIQQALNDAISEFEKKSKQGFKLNDYKIQDDLDEFKRFFSEFEMIFPDASNVKKLEQTRITLSNIEMIVDKMENGDLKGKLSLEQQLKIYEAQKEFKNKEIQLESERLKARAEFLIENKRQLAEYYNQFTEFKNRGISGISRNSSEAAKFYTSAYTTGLRAVYSSSFINREAKTTDKERQKFYQKTQSELDIIASAIKNIKDGLFAGDFISQYNM